MSSTRSLKFVVSASTTLSKLNQQLLTLVQMILISRLKLVSGSILQMIRGGLEIPTSTYRIRLWGCSPVRPWLRHHTRSPPEPFHLQQQPDTSTSAAKFCSRSLPPTCNARQSSPPRLPAPRSRSPSRWPGPRTGSREDRPRLPVIGSTSRSNKSKAFSTTFHGSIVLEWIWVGFPPLPLLALGFWKTEWKKRMGSGVKSSSLFWGG